MPDKAADILAPSDPTWNPEAAVPPAYGMANPNPPAPDMLAPRGVSDAPPPQPPPDPNMITPAQAFTPPIPSEQHPNNPDIERATHESWWRKTLDTVGTILGGDQTYKITKAPDGTMTASYEPSTTGEKWGRVAMAALSGASKGLANSQGPGGLARAAAAGTQEGLKQPQQLREDVDQQLLHRAQMIKLNQETVANAFTLKNLPQEYRQKQTQNALQTAKLMDELGITPMAMNVTDRAQLHRLGVDDPASVPAHLEGNMFIEPSGKGGVNFYNVPPSVANQRTTSPSKWTEVVLDPEDSGKTKEIEHITPAGEKYSEYVKRTMAQNALNDRATSMALRNKLAKEKAAQPKNPTEASLALDAETNPDPVKRKQSLDALNLLNRIKGEGGAAGAGGFNTQETLQRNAEMMVDGLAAPSQMSKRAKEYNQMLPMANQYSMQKYGQPFDAEISEARYKARSEVLQQAATGKPADQIQSFQTFTNHAQSLMDDVAHLRTTNTKVLNMAWNKLRNLSGSADVTAVQTHIQALRREYLNFLSNNYALKEEEIKEGHKIVEDTSSPAQMEEAVRAFMTTAIGRVSALNNRFQRFDVPIGGDILTPQNYQTIKNLGLGDYADQMIKPAKAAPRMFSGAQPGAQPQPQPQPGAQPTTGDWKDNPTGMEGIPQPIAPIRPAATTPKPGDAGKGTSAPPTDGKGQTWDAHIWKSANPGKDVKPMIKWAKEHNFSVINE